MDKQFEEQYYESELKNWWFVSRRAAILKLIHDYDRDIKILDVGCGGGSLMHDLIKHGFKNVYGIDNSEKAITVCKQRNIKNVQLMDIQIPAFGEKTFDLIIASDILEHCGNDQLVLKNFFNILDGNGMLLIFVPAYNLFWSNFDEVNHHYRRYSKKELISKLKAVDFHIERTSFWNFSLFFPALFNQIKSKIFNNNSSTLKQNLLLNDNNSFFIHSLILLLKVENIFFKYTGLPVGLSVFVLARKTR